MGRCDLKRCLTRILRSDLLADDPTQKGEVTLQEGKVMRVTIAGVSSSITTIRLNRTGHLSALVSDGSGGWNQICDYLLIDDLDDECHVILVELKKTLQERNKAFEQLRRSLPMADYLLSVCGVELGTSWPRTVSYVLIAEKRTNRFDKQRVRPRPGLRDRESHYYHGIEVSVFLGTTAKLPISSRVDRNPAGHARN